MLRKAITRLAALEDEERFLKTQASGSRGALNVQDVRKRFEREAQIRREKEVWTAWVRESLVPSAYLGFSGLVGDQQFANLGVVLMGVLADVMSVVGAPSMSADEAENECYSKIAETGRSREDVVAGKARSLMATSIRVTGLQSGELVERQYDSDDLGEVIERKTNNWETRHGRDADGIDGEATTSTSTTSTGKETGAAILAMEAEQERSISPADRTAAPSANGGNVSAESMVLAEIKREARPTKAKRKEKRSKKRSAIDDLFAGLT